MLPIYKRMFPRGRQGSSILGQTLRRFDTSSPLTLSLRNPSLPIALSSTTFAADDSTIINCHGVVTHYFRRNTTGTSISPILPFDRRCLMDRYEHQNLRKRNYFPSSRRANDMIRMLMTTSDTNRGENDEHLFSIRRPEKGTGFDNFLPKDDPNDEKSRNNNADEKMKNNNNSNKNDNNNNNNDNQSFNSLLLFIAMVAFVYYLENGDNMERSEHHDPNNGNGSSSNNRQQWGKEISWHDFLRLLQQRDIIKVVVADERKMARVFIKPNSIGLNNNNARYNDSISTIEFDHHQQQQKSGQPQTEHSDISASSGDLSHLDRMDGFHSQRNNNSMISNGVVSEPMFPYYRIHIGSIDSFERKFEDAQRALYGNDTSQDVPIQYSPDNTIGRELLGIIPGLLLAGLMFALMRFASGAGLPGGGGIGGGGRGGGGGGMGGIFQIGKSTHKRINKEDVKVTFQDVAGCDEAKKEIMEFVDFLKDSERFTKLGAKIPKGALLCGPPGTGKTLLAKAVAGEAGVPFYSISGSDFIEMFVGVGPSRVRDLFSEARNNAPCIVFIDEIDAVGRQRGRGGVNGNDERENTLNQLLVEMDGFSPSTGVVVLAGTNRVDILDNALTRAGRFDRQIMVDKPDLKGRQAIFKVHLKGITLEDNIEDIAGRLAGLTPGFAGADIANICNEAAIVAARRKGEKVTLEDFEKATDRIIGGSESNKIMSKEERSIVAHHEAGHAVAGWFLQHADLLMKVTIIPRSNGSLGFAQYLPKEVFLRTQEQIMDIVCMALAGRAAEEIVFGKVTTGASDDLRRVTKLVYSTIQLYGMNHRLGQLSFPKDPNAMFDDRPYSEKTAKAMDEEAKIIVDQAYNRTLQLLRDKKNELSIVATMLLEKETITHDDILTAIGSRPFKGDKAYEDFVSSRKKGQPANDKHNDGATSPKINNESGSTPSGLSPAF